MSIMVDDMFSFLNWLNKVMSEKNITQADIARTGFVTRGAVSLLFSNRLKSLGVDMCRAISAASGIPLKIVYNKAGLLPYDPELSPLEEKLMQDVVGLSQADLEWVISIVDARKEQYRVNPDLIPR
jgi:transcriptional regulator with XRE-family HTH domain